MSDFNIFSQLKDEIEDFNTGYVEIASSNDSGTVRYLANGSKGYQFSQKETLNLIDLYYNSKFDSGEIDSEGQRKSFLNIGKFRADVAAKQVDIDASHFKFIPELPASEWGAFFVNKQFSIWSNEIGFGQVINDAIQDYTKYGTTVLKKTKAGVERVSLRTLKNQQKAKSLKEATYVIEEHDEMTLDDMEEMKGWNTEGVELKFGETKCVYERYGKVPLSFLKQFHDQEVQDGDDVRGVETMAILIMDAPKRASKNLGGTILFLEEINERPYEECHWSRQDGRWLGIGEIENQFENQVMRNMIANMRRRGLLWSSKKIFQSRDNEVAKNLVKEVRDGEVLKISAGGEITQVNMNTQNLVEFSNAEQEWERNSDQKSFTFEVATGEALPSGTPFRLGVVLSNAVNSHFGLKRENLGMFLKRTVENQVYPLFKTENNKKHVLSLLSDEEGVGLLKKAFIRNHTNLEVKEAILNGVLPNVEEIKMKVEEDIGKRKILFIDMIEGYYTDLKLKVQLVITGENVDLPAKIETLTNLFNALSQKQDPRADAVLEKILSLTGENFEAIAGMKSQQPAQVQAQQGMSQMMPAMAQANQPI